MRERVFVVTPESTGWCVQVAERMNRRFRTSAEAFKAAARAARKSRRAGRFAWVKVDSVKDEPRRAAR